MKTISFEKAKYLRAGQTVYRLVVGVDKNTMQLTTYIERQFLSGKKYLPGDYSVYQFAADDYDAVFVKNKGRNEKEDVFRLDLVPRDNHEYYFDSYRAVLRAIEEFQQGFHHELVEKWMEEARAHVALCKEYEERRRKREEEYAANPELAKQNMPIRAWGETEMRSYHPEWLR